MTHFTHLYKICQKYSALKVLTCCPHASLTVSTQFAVEAYRADVQNCTESIKHGVQQLDTVWTSRCSIPGSSNKFLPSPKGPDYTWLSTSFLLSM